MSVLIKNMEMPEHCGYCRFRYDGICHALQKTHYSMTECPLVSAPEQKRKKGKWIDDCSCSICHWIHEDDKGFALLTDYHFCPNCGTDMREEKEDDND